MAYVVETVKLPRGLDFVSDLNAGLGVIRLDPLSGPAAPAGPRGDP
jgi:hypothetical protein